MRSLKVRFGNPLPLFSLKMLGAGPFCGNPVTGAIFSMFDFVFSCTTMSMLVGNSTLPLTWSKCVWVLITVVMGLGVSSLILSRSGCPQPGFLVSTTTTPFVVTKTELLPPPPFRTQKLSLSFSTSMTFGCWPPAG